MSSLLLAPLLSHFSPFDFAVLALVSLHLLFSFVAAAYVLHFHLRSSSTSPSPSLCRRLRRLLHLNSLWPVRLLLLFFASLLSFSELLRLPLNRPWLCDAYALSSQSFAEPAFFATLLFLLRASTESKPSSSSSVIAAFLVAISASLPFLVLHSLFLFVLPWALRLLALPPDFVTSATLSDRCGHPLFGTVLLALLGAIYVPLFISVCWSAVTVVINKKLTNRLYALVAAVVVALSAQVSSLALSSLWNPSCITSQVLGVVGFMAVLMCVVVGEEILVVLPVVDALAIVEPERSTCDIARKKNGGELEV